MHVSKSSAETNKSLFCSGRSPEVCYNSPLIKQQKPTKSNHETHRDRQVMTSEMEQAPHTLRAIIQHFGDISTQSYHLGRRYSVVKPSSSTERLAARRYSLGPKTHFRFGFVFGSAVLIKLG